MILKKQPCRGRNNLALLIRKHKVNVKMKKWSMAEFTAQLDKLYKTIPPLDEQPRFKWKIRTPQDDN